MDIPETLARIKSVLAALKYTGDETVFHADSVQITDTTPQIKTRPAAWIRFQGLPPYGDYSDTLTIANIDVELEVSSTTEHSEGHVVDVARVTNAQQGASLTTILAKVVPALRLVDTDSGGAHSTWIRYTGAGTIQNKGAIGSITLNLEALVETA